MQFDPLRYEDLRNPYPIYRKLRDEAPVYQTPGSGIWCVSRYDDVQAVLKSPDAFSSRAMFTMLMNQGNEGMPPLSWGMLRFVVRMLVQTRLDPRGFATARNLIAEDGARHTGMRNIVNRGFTPRQIAALEPRVRAGVEACMARLRKGEGFDVMSEVAIPLPVSIIAELLGVEPDRLADFKRWSDAFVANISGAGRQDPFNPRFQDAMIGLIRYIQRIARARRAEPTDDLISTILAEQDGDVALTNREVVQFVILLLVAGNETTTNLIGNAVSALLDNPEALKCLAREPERVPQALEETLRYDAPIQQVFRKATRDSEIAGTRIPEGGTVAVLIGSANRDERRFPDPDRFDLERDVRGHLGFGFGKHFCLGASLARLEARAALEALAPELPNFARAAGERELVDSFLVRGPRRLELRAVA